MLNVSKPLLTLILILLNLQCLIAQSENTVFYKDSLVTDTLKNIVVSGSRTIEQRSEVVQEIKVISRADIQNTNAANTADLLQNLGLAAVQKSQLGGGSPVLRGFEANRVLLVVDGVRHNNLIFRSGHLQNIISLDANAANRIEVLYGNGAMIYGSDALGGVISLQTQKPELSGTKAYAVSGNALARYATAADERTLSANINLAGKYFASRTVITGAAFGSLRKGANNTFGYEGFGDCKQYVSGYNAKTDTIFTNADPNVQVGTNYAQIDVLQRLRYQKNSAHEHNLNLQYSTSSNVPRYDRLQTFSKGKPRFSEWYYGPQSRLLAAYHYDNQAKNRFWDKLNTTIAYQNVQESRHTRRFKDDNLQQQFENVQVASLNTDIAKQIQDHELRYGTEVFLQQNTSTARNVNVADFGSLAPAQASALGARYPNGRAATAALYLTDAIEFGQLKQTDKKSPLAVVRGGLRFTVNSLTANFTDFALGGDTQYRSFTQQNNSLDGSLGGVFFMQNGFRLAANIATGFRTPNIDDLGKTFEQTNGTIVLPNANLQPERTFQKELTLERSTRNGFNVAITAFHTNMTNGIVIKAQPFNGQDSVTYNGARYLAVANTNTSESVRYGANLSFSTPLFIKSLSANGSIAYTYGRDLTTNTPLDHIPPTYGILSLQYQRKKWSAQAFTLFNAWKHLTEYAPIGEDNPDKATPEGTFAWATLNARGSYAFTPNIKLQINIENLLDANYRTFASGISAAGRNISATLRYNWF